ncbi:MAG: hypothetical protein AABZ31_06940 [Bdellovibrionota bacterium]
MGNKLEAVKKQIVLGLLLVSGISTPNFASAFDASELMTPDELEGFADVAVNSEYMIRPGDPRDRRPGPGRGDRDRDRRDRDRRPGPPDRRPYPPRRPEPPRRPYPPVRYVYQCFARDDRQHTYMAQDRYDSYYAQREAMRECYRYARYCYEMGCRQVRR